MEDAPNLPESDDVPLVAIGASAGGLEPLEQFFDAVGDAPGVAFVVVQHLSPDYRSMMNELLARRSSLPIRHVEDGMRVEPNTIFLNRPSEYLELNGDTFRTFTYLEGQELPHLPIDRFFTSLSSRDWNRTVAVVLSGSGSDGSQGAQTLHEAGAAVLVQSMQEASFPSMPRAVLLSGSVDRVLDAGAMPAAIQDIFTYGKKSAGPEKPVFGDSIKRILGLLEKRHNVDFSNYKPTNVNRRIVRRLHLRGHASLPEYEQVLQQSDEVLSELFSDLLIGVTEFYRDPDAIASLRRNVLDPLAADIKNQTPIKVWVAACASGEEVYTIAIELSEALRAAGSDRRFRIIGTDIHARSIDIASRGYYEAEKLAHLPAALRERYFVETGDGYTIDPVLRQKIIFSTQNLTNDPPFMNLDLVSCRNLLIYLREEPQASAISMFMFGLLNSGYLFLGASETLGKYKSAFEIIDARWRIFRKVKQRFKPGQPGLTPRRTAPIPQRELTGMREMDGRARFQAQVNPQRSRELLVRSYDALLKRYAPSGILLTEDTQVLNWFGAASACIDTMNNLADWTMQGIVHPDLHFPINVGIEKLRMGQGTVSPRRVTVSLPDTDPRECLVEVEALEAEGGQRLILAKVTFQDGEVSGGMPRQEIVSAEEISTSKTDAAVLNRRIYALERDLKLTEETLQHVTERLEASGEELQASNEELQASNEELQASNEELQSSNEELHAVNEELVSVSAEHERKIEMLSELNQNTEAVLQLLNTGVVVLDDADCILRFSNLVEQKFLLKDHDVGRSIATVGPRLEFAELPAMTAALRDTGTPQYAEGQHNGHPLRVDVRANRSAGQTGETDAMGAVVLLRWG